MVARTGADRAVFRSPASSAPNFALFAMIFVLALSALPCLAAELAVLRNGFTIPHDHHLTTGATTRLFLSADESSFTDVATADITGFEKDLTLPAASNATPAPQPGMSSAPARSHVDLSEVVNSASAAYHLDPDLVNSVIHAESGFNAHAVSPKGARGLMQLMPSTASDLGVKDAFDSADNVEGGSRYLRELLERYDFDLVKALAAYNAGPHRVDHYNGVPPFYETRAYVARIVHDYNRKKIAQEKAAQAEKKRLTPSTAAAPSSKLRAAKTGRSRQSSSAQTSSASPRNAAVLSKYSATSTAPPAAKPSSTPTPR
jgi:soluble lytic murein transglycosylase-like protein